MIHEIGVDVAARMTARGVPIPVIDGPEPAETSTFARERVVIEYDENAGDDFDNVLGQRQNPKHHFTRHIAGKITLYVQCPAAGATQWEHRQRADHLLDQVLVALREVAVKRRNELKLTGGKFTRPSDLAMSPTIGGAKYELTFTFARAVIATTWAGDARPEAVAGTDFALTHTGNVHTAGGTPEPCC